MSARSRSVTSPRRRRSRWLVLYIILASAVIAAFVTMGLVAKSSLVVDDSSPTPVSAATSVPQSKTFCEAARALEEAATTAPAQEGTERTVGDGLRKAAGLFDQLADLATPEYGSADWKSVSSTYDAAVDRYDASGGSVADDTFLLLLAQAVDAQNHAIQTWSPAVLASCQVDLGPLTVTR